MLEPSCICILFLAYVSWVPVNIMTGRSCYFWKCDRNIGCRFFVYILTWTFEKSTIDLSAATIRSWWHQWEIVAASHCHSWWKWFSGHKLVTRLFCADFVFSGTDTRVTFKLTLAFSLNFIHMHVFLDLNVYRWTRTLWLRSPMLLVLETLCWWLPMQMSFPAMAWRLVSPIMLLAHFCALCQTIFESIWSK
jgi:hypothetical protein